MKVLLYILSGYLVACYLWSMYVLVRLLRPRWLRWVRPRVVGKLIRPALRQAKEHADQQRAA